jgi:hypothetical protein
MGGTCGMHREEYKYIGVCVRKPEERRSLGICQRDERIILKWMLKK